jgi:beta-N-acetylhexosaminidase
MGQLFMMGFDGTTVSPQIRSLIENYHLGSILLTAKNLKCIILESIPLMSNPFQI